MARNRSRSRRSYYTSNRRLPRSSFDSYYAMPRVSRARLRLSTSPTWSPRIVRKARKYTVRLRSRVAYNSVQPRKNPNPFGQLRLYSPSMVINQLNLPRRALVCLRRSVRKQVMFAFNKAGKSGQKRPRRSQDSHIKC